MMKISGVYKIENLINGRVRIGETSDIIKRLSNYKATLRKGNYNGKEMQDDFNAYGEDMFSFELLEICPIQKLKKCEEYYLKKYRDRCVYNKNKVRTYEKIDRQGEEAEEYRQLRSEVTKGSKNGNAQIDEMIAAHIKFACKYSDLKQYEIAEIYGVSVNMVAKISAGLRWVDVQPVEPK
ncbi:MAG: GIY-YIG nuclease family protein [Tissierellia bacterium]|nr:GIY-YIG nuclease family protein [Tissierellia bacterium]